MTHAAADDRADHGWRYVASRSAGDVDGEDLWEVRELYPTSGGGFGYTADPVSAAGTTLNELRRDLATMLADTFRPSLDLVTDTPVLDETGMTAQTPTSAPPDVIRDLLAYLCE